MNYIENIKDLLEARRNALRWANKYPLEAIKTLAIPIGAYLNDKIMGKRRIRRNLVPTDYKGKPYNSYMNPQIFTGSNTNSAMSTASASATSCSASLHSAITGLSKSSYNSLTLAAPNHQVEKATKRSRIISKSRRSKYSTSSFARQLMFKHLCPKIRIMGHIPVSNKMQCDSGVQAVYNGTNWQDNAFTFPSGPFLRQLLYKLHTDLNYGQRGGGVGVDVPGGTEGISTGQAFVFPFGTLAAYAVGGSSAREELEYVNGPNALATTPGSGTLANTKHNIDLPGLIVKYYSRKYTLMNTSTACASITIYQWAYNGNDSAAKDLSTNLNYLPSDCWTEDLKEGQGNYPDLSIAGMGYFTSDARVHPVYSKTRLITDLGERPQANGRKSKVMDANYRCEKVTAINLQPGQSIVHHVFLPGFYLSARDLIYGERFRHKQRTLMFIINGELAFEGALEAQVSNKIGTSSVFINYEIESDCVAQTVPHNRPQSTFMCNEDLVSTDNRDYTLSSAFMCRVDPVKTEQAENVDDGAACTDNADR